MQIMTIGKIYKNYFNTYLKRFTYKICCSMHTKMIHSMRLYPTIYSSMIFIRNKVLETYYAVTDNAYSIGQT